MPNERREVPVRIKDCPLNLEGQAWLISNIYRTYLTSHEHCHDGETLLTHHLDKSGEYLKTEGCENCVLKNGKSPQK